MEGYENPLKALDEVKAEHDLAREKRLAAEMYLSCAALQAFMEGEDLQTIGEKCGYDFSGDAKLEKENGGNGLQQHWSIWDRPVQITEREKFADWLCAQLWNRLSLVMLGELKGDGK